MIKFFRKIRQALINENKLSKYLLYAIGEIVLVVIGILIAISINGWNEERKEHQNEHKLYLKIISDLDKEMGIIEEAINKFKSYEDLHYHLFNVKTGKEKINPQMPYGELRWDVQFVPTFKDNYQDRIDEISNDSIREYINRYFRLEQQVVVHNELVKDLKANMVRPYITTNGLVQAKDVYVENRYKEVDTRKSLDIETLSEKITTPEFDQILYELKVKTVGAIKHFNFLIESNKELRAILQKGVDNRIG